MHADAIQISHLCCGPHHCGDAFSLVESWLDTADRRSLASVVAAHTRHRRRLDVDSTIIVSTRASCRWVITNTRLTRTSHMQGFVPAAGGRLACFARRRTQASQLRMEEA